MRHLIVGGDGQLGTALALECERSRLGCISTSRRTVDSAGGRLRLDLRDPRGSWNLPRDVSVAYLLSAVTSEKTCQADPVASRKINVEATVQLARRLLEMGVHIIFASTNLVFDGTKAYQDPDATPSPRTEYGRHKAEAETALLSLGGSVCILRMTKLLHPAMPLLAQWRSSLRSGLQIEAFFDLPLSPLPLPWVAANLLRLGELRPKGILQLSLDRDVTYFDLARSGAALIGADPSLVVPKSASEAGIAHVPLHTTLESDRALKLLEKPLPRYEDVVKYAFDPGLSI